LPEVAGVDIAPGDSLAHLGQICHLCIEKDGLGYQVFNAANDTVSANTPSKELAKRFFPNVPFTREIGEYEGLLSNRKIREV
ncbi:hypothetical protein AB9E26_36505, partial [Rhizobium leguminosarum]